MHIVLYQPEIPANTGNVVRLCAVTGCHLHLIRPLGFSTDDRQLKRAGLDYWHLLDIDYWDDIRDLFAAYQDNPKFFLTSKATKGYTQVQYGPDSLLIFGRETSGLPDWIHAEFPEQIVILRVAVIVVTGHLGRKVILRGLSGTRIVKVVRHGVPGLSVLKDRPLHLSSASGYAPHESFGEGKTAV